jgi:membrane fusion protein, multidrug efflux system
VEVITDLYGSEIVYHGEVQGLQPGTGSSFALFPADNSTGNFIHVAERVPVRIGLRLEELRAHPLRPGLSTLTRIHTLEKGENLLSSTVKTEDNAYYATDIFANELNETEALIKEIISKNLIHQETAFIESQQ